MTDIDLLVEVNRAAGGAPAAASEREARERPEGREGGPGRESRGGASQTPAAVSADVQPAWLQRAGPQGGDAIHLRGLGKSFGERQVLAGIDLDIRPGEFVAVIGRSGCGKSTLLRLLAGLDQPTAGELDAGPKKDVRFMFQDARLLPWARVQDNVALGLAGPEGRERAAAALAQVGLGERGPEWPARLSGGQRQRVALARALVHTPRLLLLDEPLGALDALTRIEMQRLIERLWLRQGFTAVLVTHDVAEAVALADRVLLIEHGHLALDLRIDLPRPRVRDAAFAALEQRLLDRVLQVPDAADVTPPFGSASIPSAIAAPQLRWAV
ncbi:ATP-binding cassette domain-containing protein [Roseateles sp. SL47]|uniref:ATP-binding cassette domain-containing protein n=1 Tax=Roseateles sp. SL47 TaxID=2995138 RepID=UPI00226EB3EF|nr:ATP-binding cassette domain-containing protein [Roseateles sp. SL47]WAC70953.1 ATP-binding cassette domain-containing protein [Roseateles sp. SL47]